MHVGKPLGVKNAIGLVNSDTASASPTGTVSLTSAPTPLGVGPSGGENARLSLELSLTTSPAAAFRGSGSVAMPVCVLQASVIPSPLGPTRAAPLNVPTSTPVWKQGDIDSEGPPTDGSLVRALPLSSAVHPVQPDSVNGLPPLPVRIT